MWNGRAIMPYLPRKGRFLYSLHWNTLEWYFAVCRIDECDSTLSRDCLLCLIKESIRYRLNVQDTACNFGQDFFSLGHVVFYSHTKFYAFLAIHFPSQAELLWSIKLFKGNSLPSWGGRGFAQHESVGIWFEGMGTFAMPACAITWRWLKRNGYCNGHLSLVT